MLPLLQVSADADLLTTDRVLVAAVVIVAFCLAVVFFYLVLLGAFVGVGRLLYLVFDSRSQGERNVATVISPRAWSQGGKSAREYRNLLARRWWLILTLIVATATALHVTYADVWPQVFIATIILGLACWLGSLAGAQLYYTAISLISQRYEVR